MRGLYAIVDLDTLERRGLDPLAFAAALLEARPAALQLRAKSQQPADVLALLKALRPLCTEASALLVANDRPDLALIAGTDMLHVGQTDASPSLVRSIAPRLRFGVSTHTPEQLTRALASMPAYLAYGPVWPTRSKGEPDAIVGVSGLKQASRLLRHHAKLTGLDVPLVAIGGITLERVVEISAYASAVAVISDLVAPPELAGTAALAYTRERAARYVDALGDELRPDRTSLHL